MKRETLLKKKNEKDEINVEQVIRKDRANIKSLRAKKELELLDVDGSIESYLKNPTQNMDDQFVALCASKEVIEKYISVLDKIEEEYL